MIGNGQEVLKTTIADDATRDAFGRIRVSNIFTGFTNKFEYQNRSHLWWEVDETSTKVTESTVNQNASVINMPIIASAGKKLIRQTKTWPPYQPGNSHRPLLTAAFGSATEGISKKFGLFYSKDGIYFEQDENGIYNIVLRSSSSGSIVERKIPQSEWNIDTFSSTGKNPSGLNENSTRNEDGAPFSFENSIILDIDLEWLGVGRVRVGFNHSGNTLYAHEFNNAGFNALTYMSTASLPLRYEIENVTGVNTGSMTQICQTVKVEGGSDLWGFPQVASTGVTPVSATNGVATPILFVRPMSTFYGKENRIGTIPFSYSIITIGNFPAFVEILHEPTVSATWTQIDATTEHGSATEYSAGANITSVTGGHAHKKFHITADNKGTLASGGEFVQNIYLNRGFDHTVDADAEPYGIRLTPIGGNLSVYASIEVAEIY